MILTVLAILVAVTFVGTGAAKLFAVPVSVTMRDSLDVEPARWKQIGMLEWLGVVGVLVGLAWWPLGLLASLALTALIAGAVVVRFRAGRRHHRSETAGFVLDGVTLALTLATAVAFVAQS